METLQAVDRVAAKAAPGRSPSFGGAHALKALEDISIKGTIGRSKLSKELHLGEGETRTLVKHLKNEGLIQVSRSGISLSNVGRRLLSNLRMYISEEIEIPPTSLTVGRFNIAVRVTGASSSVKYGLEQRDAAILAGAKGATTLIFSRGKLIIPGTGEDASDNDISIRNALSKLYLKDGDIIIIGSADEKIRAELGAKTAALDALIKKH